MVEKYISKIHITRKRVIIVVLLLIAIIGISLPTAIWISLMSLPEENQAEFILGYDGADLDFGTIDYSGIEYFVDGTSYFTDASGIISFALNDNDEHVFQIIWQGELIEFVFNTSITENILLSCKSIDSTLLWDEINLPLGGMTESTFDLLYFDGTSWTLIETAVRVGALIDFNNLIMGSYKLVKTTETDGLIFMIDQQTITYTEDILIIPNKAILDLEYLSTFLGNDVAVNLADITYELQIYGSGTWKPLSDFSNYYVIIVVDDVNGLITIYELLHSQTYRIFIANTWNEGFEFLTDELTEISLIAKSLDATFTWSSDGEPAVGENVSLYWHDGIGWIKVGDYVTDVLGKVVITELLPIGTYKFDSNTEFYITADDSVKIVTYAIESTSAEREQFPPWISLVGSGIQAFFFMLIKN